MISSAQDTDRLIVDRPSSFDDLIVGHLRQKRRKFGEQFLLQPRLYGVDEYRDTSTLRRLQSTGSAEVSLQVSRLKFRIL